MSVQLSRRDRIAHVAALQAERARRRGAYPLSSAQLRLWLIDRADPGSPAYNVSRAFALAGLLDVRALEAAVLAVVARHAPLRTAFPVQGGEPVQLVLEPSTVRISHVDVSPFARERRRQEVERIAASEAAHRFALDAGPPLRAVLVRLGEADHAFVMTAHHIAVDERSLEILYAELREAYAAFSAGLRPCSTPLAPSYAELAVRERLERASDDVSRQLEFWKTSLAGSTPDIALPYARLRPRVPRFAGACERVPLGARGVAALKDAARRAETTPFTAYLAAFAVLLHAFSGAHDVVVGTPISSRRGSESEATIGFFANALALRIAIAGDAPFDDLVRRVRGVVLNAFVNCDVPFDDVVAHVARLRGANGSPLFRVMFALQPGAGSQFSLPGIAVTPLRAPQAAAKFDLTGLVYDGDEPAFELVYDVDLFERATGAAMARAYAAALEALADAPLAALDALAPAPPTGGPPAAAANRLDVPRVQLEPGERDVLEASLCDMWEAVLGRRPASALDDFFELGGHSLLAFRLVERIGAELGVALPLASLFEEPTVAGMARAVASRARAPALSPLRPIRSGTKGLPVILFHGVLDGGAFYLRAVADRLSERTVYALPPHGVDGGPVPATFEAMAADRLALLRAEGVAPPYDLIGYCNGALVALEAARLLVAEGFPAPLVVAIDADVESPLARRIVRAVSVTAAVGLGEGARSALALRLLQRANRLARMTGLRDGGRFVADQVRSLSRYLRSRRAGAAAPAQRNLLEIYRERFLRYRSRPYAGRVVLLVPSGAPFANARAARWSKVSPTVRVRPIEGDHTSSVSVRGAALAERLRECLDD